MSLNPIAYTDHVVADFLRYQLTAYPFSDERLYKQLRELLSMDETRRTPLLKGPYVSLSQSFRMGSSTANLVSEGLLHPYLQQLAFPELWGHQEQAICAVQSGLSTLVSTGTGSGKTECFLYPVISRSLTLRDQGAPPGIAAVFVYPMNALAEDQLERLRGLLSGSGVTFGLYVGKTPESDAGVTGECLPVGSSRADYEAARARASEEKRGTVVHPPEERVSREQMRTAGQQPRILLTNVKQLELLLTREKDLSLFDGADLRFLVFDEAHTYGGASGGEAACLVRRLRSFCGKGPDEVVCIGTSATLVDAEGDPDAARAFASRFFGVPGDTVGLVTEQYEADDWPEDRKLPEAPPGDPNTHLEAVLSALDHADEDPSILAAAFDSFCGKKIDEADWQSSLHEALSGNELCYRLSRDLSDPQLLSELAEALSRDLNRDVSEAEILTWLALGASARLDGRPLLRSVVHAFSSGIGSAAVSFPSNGVTPRLHLAGHEEAAEEAEPLARLPIKTCSTCGQHYFIHHLKDLRFGDTGLEGGDAVGEAQVWPALDEARGGIRLVLLDRLISEEDADADAEDAELPKRTIEVFVCRHCGALHRKAEDHCLGCGRDAELYRLLAVEHSEKHGGWLTTCLCCGAHGGSWVGQRREPARPVRAVPVSDVHVLAQNMIEHADRRRLLIFSDNRQEAAFQAGWMRDHARRYRIRALMNERVEEGPVSIGDLVAHLSRVLDDDDEMSRSIIPEVWDVARKEAAGSTHADERRYFLRILVLRELTTGVKQRIGLEPWGRTRIVYQGLDPQLPFIQNWSTRLGVEPEALVGGIAQLLDVQRRGGLLYDREAGIFTRFWNEGDREIQRGYLPRMPGIPKGLKLRRGGSDEKNRIQQWISEKGLTGARHAAHRWGALSVGSGSSKTDAAVEFLEDLWSLLTNELSLLVPVTLKGSKGGALPHCAGAHQLDADRIQLTPHAGRWRCGVCRRTYTRSGPHDACIAWRCTGTVSFVPDDPDDYDLRVLSERFAMIRPAEHSAQVPAARREQLEQWFKSEDGERVNALVCTPTLEMGVDIGGLDTVLLRNVPPLPANYWQRVGRAGRRHRLAVNFTYARPTTHDRAYFKNPLKLLNGRVEPPRFNLRNEVMLGKHVRAAVLTRLRQLAAGTVGLSAFDRDEMQASLDTVFPDWVKDYLFDGEGHLRSEVLDVSALRTVVTKHLDELVRSVRATFQEGWPEEDAGVVEEDRLRSLILEMPDQLDAFVRVLRKRLDWAMDQRNRLRLQQDKKGTLDPDEEQLLRRCEALIKRLKGAKALHWKKASGYDDTYTLGALAAEGFLPGHGLETGAVVATAQMPRYLGDDFSLPRPPAVALREYVPGNLIYANGHRFVARYFHFAVGEDREQPIRLAVDIEHGAVTELGAESEGSGVSTLAAQQLTAVAIADVDLAHVSRISDDEDYRFQLPVAIEGYERNRHSGGWGYHWGEQHGRQVLLRRGTHLRLVNLGASWKVKEGQLGYPLGLISGQSRSPFASDAELDNFADTEMERTGKRFSWAGFYSDSVADSLTFRDFENRQEAHSILEALRVGMSLVLDMEQEDIQVLVVGHSGTEVCDGLLFDPMPGGSGLLEQACDRWSEVVAAAAEALQCPAACERSCEDCLWTYRNSWIHRYLDRHLALEKLGEWGTELSDSWVIPPELPQAKPGADELPVNAAEDRLKTLLESAGFTGGEYQKQIVLGKPLGSTTPDVFFHWDLDEDTGVCVYLDGLSQHIHGNPATQQKDAQIREQLRSLGYELVEIPASHLWDQHAMIGHFRRLGLLLEGPQRGKAVVDDPSWYLEETSPAGAELDHGQDYGPSEVVTAAAAESRQWDPDLFDERWRELLRPFASREDVTVLPGGDVALDGQVIGSFVAEVSQPDGDTVRVVDSSISDQSGAASRLKEQGFTVLFADPADPETPDRLHTLLEG